MASIKKRPDGVWRARYRDDAGKEHARHFKRRVDAQRWLDEVTTDRYTGRYVDPKAGRITFKAFFQEWSARQVWTPGTLDAAARAVESTTFRDVPIGKITGAHVEEWVKAMTLPAASRKEGLAPSTIRMRANYVQMTFLAAVRDRRIPISPAADVKLPKGERGEDAMQIPTEEQVAAVLETAEDYFQPFIAVCAFAGLRLGEAAGLRVTDVDFLRRTLRVEQQVQGENNAGLRIVPPKAFSRRTLYVPEDLTVMLGRHVEEIGAREHAGELYFFSNGGSLFQRNSAGHQWRQAAKAAGLTGFTLHSLRHFYASGLIAAGCDVVTVQRAMGHSQPSITLDTYSHLWPSAEDRTREAAAGMMAGVLTSEARTQSSMGQTL